MKLYAILALLTLPGFAAGQAGGSTVRWYDLAGLVSSGLEPSEGVLPALHLEMSRPEQLEPEFYDIRLGTDPRPDSSDLAQFITEALLATTPGGDAQGEYSVDLDRGRLRVEGPAAIQDRVQGMLREVTDELLGAARVEVFLVAGERVPATATARLSAEEAVRLIELTGAQRQASDTSRRGQRLVLGRESVQACLLDYDVAVSQGISVADPTVTILREGCQVGAIVQAHPDGLWLRAWGRNGKVLSLTGSQVSERYEGLDIELPRQSTRVFHASGVIENGGALLLGSVHPSSELWLIRASSETSPPGRRGSGGLRLPLAELTSDPYLSPSVYLPRTQPSGGFLPMETENYDWMEREAADPVDYWDLMGLLKERLGDPAPNGYARQLGNSLWVHGDQEYQRAARDLLHEMRRPAGSGFVELELLYGVFPSGEAEPLAALHDGASLATRLAESGQSRRLILAGRMGDSLKLIDGVEQHYLKDFDVEIGNSTGIAEPVVDNRFVGAAVSAHASPLPDGRLSLWCQLQVQEDGPSHPFPVSFWETLNLRSRADPQAPPPQAATNPNRYVEVQLPSTHPAGLNGLQVIEGNRWSSLGSCRLGSLDRVLVAALRVQTR